MFSYCVLEVLDVSDEQVAVQLNLKFRVDLTSSDIYDLKVLTCLYDEFGLVRKFWFNFNEFRMNCEHFGCFVFCLSIKTWRSTDPFLIIEIENLFWDFISLGIQTWNWVKINEEIPYQYLGLIVKINQFISKVDIMVFLVKIKLLVAKRCWCRPFRYLIFLL